MDFYAVLGIPKDADEIAIRAAYRALARRFHPDSGSGSSPEKFREVAEAYETLMDPRRREGYDLSLPTQAEAWPVRVESFRAAPVRVEPMVTGAPVFFRPGNNFPVNDLLGDLLRSVEAEMFFFLRRR